MRTIITSKPCITFNQKNYHVTKKIYLIVLLFTSVCCQAQSPLYLWPIAGKQTGVGVVYRPNDVISGEKNNNKLIISSDLNSIVLAPVDGIVQTFNYTYYNNLTSCDFIGYAPTNNWGKDVSAIQKQFPQKKYITQYLSVTIGIKTSDGQIVYLEGIRPIQHFKTGQRISQGDTIGHIGFFFQRIAVPTIAISIEKEGQASDPMSPFGLKTTFHPIIEKNVISLSKSEAVEDYDYLISTLNEIYPGLYDYCTTKQWDSVINNLRERIPERILYRDFFTILQELISFQHDNHLVISTIPKSKYNASNFKLHDAAFGLLNDSLIITRTMPEYDSYWGKHIMSINGITEDSVIRLMRSHNFSTTDGLVKSTPSYYLALFGFNYLNYDEKTDHFDLLLDDGTHIGYSIVQNQNKGKQVCKSYSQNWFSHFFWNNDLSMNLLNDTTAYLGINSFELNELEIDSISHFLQLLNRRSIPNLIIDVRNNDGGNSETEGELFSYFADEPFTLFESKYVNKQKDFGFLNHCLNLPQDIELFLEYHPLENKGYVFDNPETIYPDAFTHYGGQVYVLTDHRTLSAAATFAYHFKKYHKGYIVGRETGSSITQMNAEKFANILLPNSNIEICVPMVKIYLDKDNIVFPYGRGVLPDYEIPLDLDELSSGNPDKIIRECLEIIGNQNHIK